MDSREILARWLLQFTQNWKFEHRTQASLDRTARKCAVNRKQRLKMNKHRAHKRKSDPRHGRRQR